MEVTAPTRVLTVAQVNRLVAGMLAERFHDIWVTGEVSNLKAYPSGHCYFVLKDDAAQLDAAMFRGSVARLKFRLEDGMQVVGHGRLDLYEPRGRFQLILDRAEPAGLGALQAAFEQLKRRLAAEGLFDEERKRPLPALPRTVGIVTSTAGAALRDMLRTLALHRARVRVLVYPAQVQGEGAAEQVAAGVRALSARDDVDVIIVGRGGGSIEDLWCFNEEVVARAIAGSRVPVVSGVGHETDFTIADFAADLRAATPTAAAQAVARGWDDLERRLGELAGRLAEAVERALADRERRLDELARHRAFESALARLADARHRAERAAARAGAAAAAGIHRRVEAANRLGERLAGQNPQARLERARRRLESATALAARRVEALAREQRARLREALARLDALSPLASIGRGYALLRTPAGAVVSRVGQVAAGDRLEALVSDGRVDCEVRGTRRGAPVEGG
ncbi:MAG: exodeoxyribonuclease VII large subunit [bacterium]